jgi:hypothetical protein
MFVLFPRLDDDERAWRCPAAVNRMTVKESGVELGMGGREQWRRREMGESCSCCAHAWRIGWRCTWGSGVGLPGGNGTMVAVAILTKRCAPRGQFETDVAMGRAQFSYY